MLSTIALINLFLVAVGILYVATKTLSRERSPLPLPPGPKPNPIVGNLTDLPPTGAQEWQHWLKHKETYGPISSVTIFGQTMIIVNDVRIAMELLEKRSALHSSRPRMVFASEIVGWEHVFALLPYSNRLRAYRKNVHGVIGSKWVISQFDHLQDVEVRRFLLRVLENPGNLIQHIRKNTGAIILKITYGYTIEPLKDDPLVDLIEETLEQFSLATVPGAWLVDMLPALKHLPSWFPGSGFKRTAAAWRKTLMDATNKPFDFAKRQIAQRTNKPSYVSKLFAQNDGNLSLEEEDDAKWSALSLYGGGADTSVSSLSCFFLAMTLHPEIQRKAQKEIDQVIGNKRLPSIGDREHLPYVNAIVKEVFRWHPIAPMALPHMTTENDTFQGYLIPKGALIIPNIWAFAHDPNVFHEPSAFKPERFLGIEGREPEPDPESIVFGFGRRKCPGRVLADGSVYLMIAQSLAVFDISKAVENGTGKEVEPTVEFTPGTISHPSPFGTSIKPRSPEHEALIRSVLVDHPWEESDSKFL